MRALAAATLLLVLLAGCSDGGDASGDEAAGRGEPAPHALARFGEVALRTSAGRFCALEADTAAERRQGLMHVTDLGPYDGMLFRFEEPTTGRFWMRNTPMPLSIAFLDDDGRVVGALDMEPCPDGTECPTYGPDRPYRLAIEVPQGHLARIGLDREGARVQVGGRCAANRPT